MTSRIILGALLAWTLSLQPAAAQVHIEGQTFDARIQVADSELHLNGVGLRAVAWLKGYAAGLYLTQKATTPAQVYAMPGAKRLQLRMLQEVQAVEFVKAFERGVARNTPESEMPGLRERMTRFAEMVNAAGKVKKGDIVNLDLMPGRGLIFTLNGVVRGAAIPGDDLYAALLRIFIGEKPTDNELKRGLLGGAAT